MPFYHLTSPVIYSGNDLNRLRRGNGDPDTSIINELEYLISIP